MNDAPSDYQHIRVTAFAPNLGAEIRDVDISGGISDAEFAEINRALLTQQGIFYKEQSEIPPSEHMAFGKKFGHLHSHPATPTMDGRPEIFEIHANKNSKVANGEHWHSYIS